MSWADLKPENRELAQKVLTQKQLRVFQHRMDGHSWHTIAIALNTTRSTCRGHYEAALQKLAKAHGVHPIDMSDKPRDIEVVMPKDHV